MSIDFYRPIPDKRVRIYKPTKYANQDRIERAIRLYCEQSGSRWNLQVRGPLGIGNGYTDGKSDIIATAHLSREELTELRDAANALLCK